MKIKDILTEMPAMVPYPKGFGKVTQNMLKQVDKSDLTPVHHQAGFGVYEGEEGYKLYLFDNEQAIGMMHFARTKAGKLEGVQIVNVFLLPEYRNKQLGLLMYNVAIHNLKYTIISQAAMTPDSRRVYTSFLKDPTVDVYAIVKGERVELSVGPNGVTTGDEAVDNRAAFVMTEVGV